jgi:uncharacterized protein YbjQ (UPF0145 family)
MLLTTTNSVEDYKIIEYKGIVSGTAVNVQKMTMTFNMQKYYTGISESISEVKAQAFEQLKQNAEKLNANAVIGIQIDVEIKSNDYLIVVTTTGTAVNIVNR